MRHALVANLQGCKLGFRGRVFGGFRHAPKHRSDGADRSQEEGGIHPNGERAPAAFEVDLKKEEG